ncbi:acetyltransferase [Flavobacterium sp. XS2P14]|uniref:acetyltransferase n=1 Tax=Flavobacterium sp. XS2P14 TaxID=3401735 RepID=UPI003AAB5E10
MLDKKVILVGYSGHGFIIADTAIENQLNLVGYAENEIVKNNPFQLDYIGNEREDGFFEKNKGVKYLIGIGDNRIREKLYNQIIEKGGEILTLISQTTSISRTASIGSGTFVNKNVSINAFARIGKNVILNTACIIEHDCIIGDSVHIAPGAVLAGNVNVGERSFIGANAVIKQGVVIGKDVLIGAGTVVLNDILDGKKVVGNPSRLIKL